MDPDPTATATADDGALAAAGIPPRRGPAFLERLGAIGAGAQASVPGFYAWAVTVAPAVYAQGSHWYAKALAYAGLASLGIAIALERKWGPRARYVGVWGLALTSGFAWLLVPAAALGPLRLDSARGAAGMVGWALFGFASAAPALRREPKTLSRLVDEAPLKPRSRIQGGDALYIAGGTLAAFLLQLIGWRVGVPERALLVRLVSIAAGLAIIGAATSVSLARHGRSLPAATGFRLRRALPWLVGLVLLGAAGVVVLLRA